MLPDKGVMCHHAGFKMKCFVGVTKHNCQKWTHVVGKHPQSQEHINRYGCADSFLPILMIENSQMQRQTGAAIESFRNDLVRGVTESVFIAAESARKLIDARNNHR
jgi:hypothetical protein